MPEIIMATRQAAIVEQLLVSQWREDKITKRWHGNFKCCRLACIAIVVLCNLRFHGADGSKIISTLGLWWHVCACVCVRKNSSSIAVVTYISYISLLSYWMHAKLCNYLRPRLEGWEVALLTVHRTGMG